MVKNGTRLARDGASEQGLAGAGLPTRSTLGIWPPSLEARRIAQEFDDFFEFLARFVDAGDVIERHPTRAFGEQLGLGLAEAHRPGAATLLHLAQRRRRPCRISRNGSELARM
jgi:hypothetical protein